MSRADDRFCLTRTRAMLRIFITAGRQVEQRCDSLPTAFARAMSSTVVRALRELGIDVPGDVRFDDDRSSSLTSPCTFLGIKWEKSQLAPDDCRAFSVHREFSRRASSEASVLGQVGESACCGVSRWRWNA